MRFLTDENIDRPIAKWLLERGHDVIEASVIASEATDEDLIAISRLQDRILITFDRDIARSRRSVRSAGTPGIAHADEPEAPRCREEVAAGIAEQADPGIGSRSATSLDEQPLHRDRCGEQPHLARRA